MKKHTTIKMNLDVSLIACLFGHSIDEKFRDEEKRCEGNDNTNYIMFTQKSIEFSF